MKTATKTSRSVVLTGAVGALALAAMGFAGVAQAGDNVYWSVGVGNAYPVYTQPAPVYVQPAPVYVRPAPIYVQPAPVYVQPRPYYQSYYGQPQVVYVQPGYRHGWNKRHGRGHDRDHDRDDDRDDDRGGRGHRQGYGQVGYGPGYYYQR